MPLPGLPLCFLLFFVDLTLLSVYDYGVLQAKVVTDEEKNYDYCVYDSDISTGFGVGALLFLLASQIIVLAASRCFCCGRSLRPGGPRACALILFLLAW